MTRCLTIELRTHSALVVVVDADGESCRIVGVAETAFDEGQTPAAKGARLQGVVEKLGVSRLPAVVALAGDGVQWQAFQLPPCPDDELPLLVRMQAQRDGMSGADEQGFDYLPLADDSGSHRRVLAFDAPARRFQEALAICEAARLKPVRAVPTSFGWAAAIRVPLHASNQQDAGGAASSHDGPVLTQLILGIAVDEASVTAVRDGQVTLVRRFKVSADSDVQSLALALNGELRRTALSLTQADGAAAKLEVLVVGADRRELAAELQDRLPYPVVVRPTRWEHGDQLPDPGDAAIAPPRWAPLAGLAAAFAAGEPTVVDLLAPRRPQEPPSRTRLIVLAGAAAAALALWTGWMAYVNVRDERLAADAAAQQLDAMAPRLEELAAVEAEAAEVQAWLDQTPNLLATLKMMSEELRPLPLDVDAYPVDDDVIATRIVASGAQLTLQAAARRDAAVRQAEDRLRTAARRVNRGAVDPNAKPAPDYQVAFTELVEPDPDAVTFPLAKEDAVKPAPGKTPGKLDVDSARDENQARKELEESDSDPTPQDEVQATANVVGGDPS
ncbi:MAG: hypothetical protein KDA61_19815 [Planctomycetales bacterium]|nr:hypothetical protein [Planctomycetales bacterium]